MNLVERGRARRGWTRMARWWAVGLGFFALGFPALYLTHEVLSWPLPVATIAVSELAVLLRFLMVDRYVFERQRPTWRRLGQYHLASAVGIGVWWSATNLFASLGMYYLAASVLGTCCSVLCAMATNFLWIWHARPAKGQGRQA